MKKTLLIICTLVLLTLGVTSCKTNSANVTFDQTNYNLAGNWYVEKVDTTLVKILDPDEEWPHIEFNTQTNRISGNVGCNNVMGDFTYNDKGSLQFDNVATTMMMCPQIQLEQQMIAAMGLVRGYTVNETTQELKMTDSAGKVVLVFGRINPRELLQYKQNF